MTGQPSDNHWQGHTATDMGLGFGGLGVWGFGVLGLGLRDVKGLSQGLGRLGAYEVESSVGLKMLEGDFVSLDKVYLEALLT